jgi:FMN-dependent NADH-azoreductase
LLGITDVESVFIEGMAFDPSKAESIVAKAIERAREVVNNFASDKVIV